MPFSTREERGFSAKTPRATHLSSDQIRHAWSQRVRDESVFSARTTYRAYLDTLKRRLAEVISGTLNPQQAEERLKTALRDIGYTPQRGFGDGKVPPAKPMSMQDLSSSRRIQLIIDTNVKKARSMGQVAASENPLTLMSLPAWELTRTGARKKPRGNWRARWKAAGDACGWVGAAKNKMVALKTSPIWQQLADGAGGFRDTIGSPYPPFAFGSGMAWVNVRRSEWKRICEAEGIDDGLEAVTDRAKELKDAKMPAQVVPSKPQKVDVGVPAGISDAKGSGNPLVTGGAARQSTDSTYIPDYSERDEANNALDDALDEIGSYANEISDRIRDASKAEAEANDEGEHGDEQEIHAALKRMRAVQAEIASLRGRIVNYGAAVENEPRPRVAADQRMYDDAMRRYAAAARRTAFEAQRKWNAVRRKVVALDERP